MDALANDSDYAAADRVAETEHALRQIRAAVDAARPQGLHGPMHVSGDVIEEVTQAAIAQLEKTPDALDEVVKTIPSAMFDAIKARPPADYDPTAWIEPFLAGRDAGIEEARLENERREGYAARMRAMRQEPAWVEIRPIKAINLWQPSNEGRDYCRFLNGEEPQTIVVRLLAAEAAEAAWLDDVERAINGALIVRVNSAELAALADAAAAAKARDVRAWTATWGLTLLAAWRNLGCLPTSSRLARFEQATWRTGREQYGAGAAA